MISKKYFLLAAAFTGLTLSAELINEIEELPEELEQEICSEPDKKPDTTPDFETPSADEIGSYAEKESSNTLIKLSIAVLSLALTAKISYKPAHRYTRSYLRYKNASSFDECKHFVLNLINDHNLFFTNYDTKPATKHLTMDDSRNCFFYGYYSYQKIECGTSEKVIQDIRDYIRNNFKDLYDYPDNYYPLTSKIESSSVYESPYKNLTSEMGSHFYHNKNSYDRSRYARGYVQMVVKHYKKSLWAEHLDRCSLSNLFTEKYPCRSY